MHNALAEGSIGDTFLKRRGFYFLFFDSFAFRAHKPLVLSIKN